MRQFVVTGLAALAAIVASGVVMTEDDASAQLLRRRSRCNPCCVQTTQTICTTQQVCQPASCTPCQSTCVEQCCNPCPSPCVEQCCNSCPNPCDQQCCSRRPRLFGRNRCCPSTCVQQCASTCATPCEPCVAEVITTEVAPIAQETVVTTETGCDPCGTTAGCDPCGTSSDPCATVASCDPCSNSYATRSGRLRNRIRCMMPVAFRR